jgi:hypothetical protein
VLKLVGGNCVCMWGGRALAGSGSVGLAGTQTGVSVLRRRRLEVGILRLEKHSEAYFYIETCGGDCGCM